MQCPYCQDNTAYFVNHIMSKHQRIPEVRKLIDLPPREKARAFLRLRRN